MSFRFTTSDEPFSKFVENRKGIELPQNHANAKTARSTLHMLNTNTQGPNFAQFRSMMHRYLSTKVYA